MADLEKSKGSPLMSPWMMSKRDECILNMANNPSNSLKHCIKNVVCPGDGFCVQLKKDRKLTLGYSASAGARLGCSSAN